MDLSELYSHPPALSTRVACRLQYTVEQVIDESFPTGSPHPTQTQIVPPALLKSPPILFTIESTVLTRRADS